MKSSIWLAAVASFLVPAAEGLHLQRRTEGSPRVVGLEMQRRQIDNPIQRDRLRRRGIVQATLDNLETLYFVNASLGTPGQPVRLHLDTGSSDLWVNTPGSTLCRSRGSPCTFAGTFTANSSSTYGYVGSYFNISYVDGSGASGDYVTDTITMGGAKVPTLQFGIGYRSTSAQGILGIGYPINEVQVGRAGKRPYANLPEQMVQDGLIASPAFSLWLNDLDANTGSVLFGGVDTEQFEGTLATLPIQAEGGVFAEFLITLTSLTLSGVSVASDQALAVLLDSGSSLTYLPDGVVQTIYDQVQASYDADEGAAYVPCSLGADTSAANSLTFSFSGPSISVRMSELVLELATANGRRPTFSNGVPACLFGIAPAGTGTNVLGDTFLRSAYVVYDMANNEISIAQTTFNATRSEVLEIGTGANAVPSATAVANPAAATQGIIRGNPFGSGNPSTGGLGSPNAAQGLDQRMGSLLAVAVACGLGMALLVL